MSTIFAPITPISKLGVATIRISGSQTIVCLQHLGITKKPLHQKTTFHKLINPVNGELLDEVLVTFFQAPFSFTGEDVAEISIHASPYIAKEIFNILAQLPEVRFAEAGEFSKRAFLNGKIDLIQAEAIPDLIAAETASQHRQSLQQLQGELGKIYESWRTAIIEVVALIEAAIDFPDEDLPAEIVVHARELVTKIVNEINVHLDDNKIGQKIKDGLSLAIIGAPNVGKSSLINFLAKSDIAIVSDIAGTTRDIVETHLQIAGIAVKIADTAGLRQSVDIIEQEGIRRALDKAQQADIKILLIDATDLRIENDCRQFIDSNTIVLINKADLLDKDFHEETLLSMLNLTFANKPIIISLQQQSNLRNFLTKLEEKILEIIPHHNAPLITQERYRLYLQNSVTSLNAFLSRKNIENIIELAAEDLRLACDEIGRISGKIDIENILDVIFSRFCIGK